MEQAELEVQLKVWKELALSKQVLMLSATRALGLAEDCSAEELEAALTESIAKGKNAAADIKAAEDKAAADIADMQDKAKIAEVRKKEAIEARETAEATVDATEKRIAAIQESTAKEVSKATAQMNDALKEMKRTQKVLADTPDNVVKKLKQLKKEKMDESNARKRAEDANKKLKKEQQAEKQKLEEAQALLEKSSELVLAYRELQTAAEEQRAQLSKLVEEGTSVDALPEFDEAVLAELDSSDQKENDKAA